MVDITAAKPFYSVLILAFACSALVAGAAVGLRPLQEANRQLDRQKNILYAAGLYDVNTPVDELFQDIETRVVELATGKFVPQEQIDPRSFNQTKAALSPDLGRQIPPESDVARLRYQERYALVYLVKEEGKLDQIVLPVRGKGLWSTMYAYVAIGGDLTTINGVSFYEHGETPGLGGEIENSRWQDGWRGKRLYDEQGDMALQVKKGKPAVNGDTPYQIDAISGATLTSKGVDQMLTFWFGDHGFKPFLAQMQMRTHTDG